MLSGSKHIIKFAAACLAVVLPLLESCNYNDKAVAYDKDIDLDMQIKQYSTGFAEVSVQASKEAYYYITCQEVTADSYPLLTSFGGDDMIVDVKLSSNLQKGLITQLLAREKEQYNAWYDSISQTTEHVTDFASYILHYTMGNHYFYHLKPNTLYWLYSFPINPQTFNPIGDLFIKTFRTRTESLYSNIRFNYRVKGYWDYCYPIDPETGMVVSSVPWVAHTVCVDTVDKTVYPTPAQYFDQVYSNLGEDVVIRRGIYTHLNDGTGDGTSSTEFESGKTYATAFSIYDGERSRTAYDIYEFTWQGPDTELFFTDQDNTPFKW